MQTTLFTHKPFMYKPFTCSEGRLFARDYTSQVIFRFAPPSMHNESCRAIIKTYTNLKKKRPRKDFHSYNSQLAAFLCKLANILTKYSQFHFHVDIGLGHARPRNY